jgi:large subunit ribosomal protein L18
MEKKAARLRRSRRTRIKIKELGMHRLKVHRTPRHVYAQIIDPTGNQVVASASTLDSEIKDDLSKNNSYTGNVAAATVVGRIIAERAKAAGVTQVAFDRAGFKFHGRVKALADAARETGLQF